MSVIHNKKTRVYLILGYSYPNQWVSKIANWSIFYQPFHSHTTDLHKYWRSGCICQSISFHRHLQRWICGGISRQRILRTPTTYFCDSWCCFPRHAASPHQLLHPDLRSVNISLYFSLVYMTVLSKKYDKWCKNVFCRRKWIRKDRSIKNCDEVAIKKITPVNF